MKCTLTMGVLGVASILVIWSAVFAAPAALSETPSVAGDESAVRGITRCANDLAMGFPITGRIAGVKVTEGSVVKPGDLLMHLDQDAETLDVERRRLLWQSTAELTAAEVKVKTLKKQVQAARQIFDTSRGISLEDLQNKELAYDLAVAEVERLKVTKNLERLDYQIAKANLERRSLRSPANGIVTKIVRQVGEGVQANEPAIKVCDLSHIQFVANVPVGQVGSLATGETVQVEIDNASAVGGEVLFVSPVVDAASGLCEVKVKLNASDDHIRPGLPARLQLHKGRGK